VDAVPPESPTARQWTLAAEKVAANPSSTKVEIADLRAAFTGWAAYDADAKTNPLSSELIPLAANLRNLGLIGLGALDILAGGKAASPDWAPEQLRSIEGMEKSIAEVRLVAIRPVQILLNAISSNGSRPKVNK
jgi:hypothetical protein